MIRALFHKKLRRRKLARVALILQVGCTTGGRKLGVNLKNRPPESKDHTGLMIMGSPSYNSDSFWE